MPPRLIVNCEKIRYINSVGVKHWILFFEELRTQEVSLLFESCAISVVYQLNFVANFIRPEEIASIQLPFLCSSCGRESIATRTITELTPGGSILLPQLKCEKCAEPLVFDENPDEYFYFLRPLATADSDS